MAVSLESTLDRRLDALLASDPVALADPYTVFDEVREHARVHPHGPVWLVTRHADVREVVRDDGVCFSRAKMHLGRRQQEALASLTPELRRAYAEVAEFENLQVVRMDPPEHERVRAIAHRAFTPARIEALRESVQRRTDELLAPLADDEVVDLSSFGYKLPLIMVAEMLGVPEPDCELIHGWTVKLARNKGGAVQPELLLEAVEAARAFGSYVEAMLEDYRRSSALPSPLVGALIDAEAGDRLTPEELSAMFVVLLFGGHETTMNLINIGLLELLRHPDQWQLLCAEPALAERAVEELLRFVTPVQWLAFFVTHDVEFGGEQLREGDSVLAVLPAANRDPRAFERPTELDLRRPDARGQLALGFGAHFCLGASLARLEGATAFRTLAERHPQLELSTDDVEWCGSALLRSVASLPVTLGPRRNR